MIDDISVNMICIYIYTLYMIYTFICMYIYIHIYIMTISTECKFAHQFWSVDQNQACFISSNNCPSFVDRWPCCACYSWIPWRLRSDELAPVGATWNCWWSYRDGSDLWYIWAKESPSNSIGSFDLHLASHRSKSRFHELVMLICLWLTVNIKIAGKWILIS